MTIGIQVTTGTHRAKVTHGTTEMVLEPGTQQTFSVYPGCTVTVEEMPETAARGSGDNGPPPKQN